MIFLVDNYDSFTHNLAQLFWVEGLQLEIARNDTFSVQSVLAKRPAGVVISPGPGRPEDAGASEALIRAASRIWARATLPSGLTQTRILTTRFSTSRAPAGMFQQASI